MEPSPPHKKKKTRAIASANRGFHVVLKEKDTGVRAQLKYGRYIISETDPSQIVSLYDLAKDWNAKGVKLTTRKELLERQAEALKCVPMAEQNLPL